MRDRIREANSEGRKNDPDAPLDKVVQEQELEEMAKLAKTVREKADAYLEKKAGSKYNSYTNSRKAVAQIAKTFGEYREDVREEERETQQKLTKTATIQSKRMLEKQNKQADGPIL